jgi:hypothetical protein
MAVNMESGRGRRGNRLSLSLWGAAACLLLLPLLAMQFTEEVNWTLSDFVVFGGMLLAACGAYELATRVARNNAYLAAAGVAIGTGFLLIWINLAVGIIGSENNPANLMFGGVLAVAILGAVIARLQPDGMARALNVTALAQALVAVVVLIAGWGHDAAILAGLFAVPWLVSAALFRKAAREQSPGLAAP